MQLFAKSGSREVGLEETSIGHLAQPPGVSDKRKMTIPIHLTTKAKHSLNQNHTDVSRERAGMQLKDVQENI